MRCRTANSAAAQEVAEPPLDSVSKPVGDESGCTVSHLHVFKKRDDAEH